MFTIFLLSLIGVPLTGGFFGKFYIFKAALESPPGVADGAGPAEQRRGGVLLPAHPGDDVHARAERGGEGSGTAAAGLAAALVSAAIGTLLLGIFPSAVLEFAGRSAVLVR